jgi:hypothetical protein
MRPLISFSRQPYQITDNLKLTTHMTRKHTNDPAAFSLEAKQGKTSGEQYTPVGVLAALAQLGDSPNSDAGDPCCGSGWNVSAEMLNRSHLAAS